MITDERIEKMERELARVRWFNRSLIACAVLSLGAWLIVKTFRPETAWAQSVAKVIVANRFILEDENGTMRGELRWAEDGAAGLGLYDEDGSLRALLTAAKDTPRLLLLDENSKVRADLAINHGPRLLLRDENSNIGVALSLRPEGPSLWLRDENGKPRISLSLDKKEPVMMLTDDGGNPIWSAP